MAAERSGDAEAALEFHRGVPMFSRGRHLGTLTQLASLSEEMTPWMWARWAACQCTRAEEKGSVTREIQRTALDYAVRMFYADQVEDAFLNGGDPVKLLAHVLGESWLFHELCTFELGGLESLLDELVTGRMQQESALARRWVGARMGGYRVLRPDDGALRVRDVGTDRDLLLLDLGAGVHADAGGWLLGRVVASGTTPELMFDTRPIAVDEQTARAVAESQTRGGWVSAVKSALDDGRVRRERFESEDLELVTDVPSLSLVEVGTPRAALVSTLESLGRGRDEVGRSAYRILSRVAAGTFGPDSMAPYVGAAVLNPHGYDEALRLLAGTGQPEAWERWASLVPDPARSRLFRLAGLATAA
jgi:hypothetical protein